MRMFNTLEEATYEIRRDLAKGPRITSTRVQQRTGQELPGRERIAYAYTLTGGIPDEAPELVSLAAHWGFPLYQKYPEEMQYWLQQEKAQRSHPQGFLGQPFLEADHPALKTTLEGQAPSYTYRERLVGAQQSMVAALVANLDSRRAYWPIFEQVDAVRSAQPTRVPCSLGYQAMIRQVSDHQELMLFYLQRSCDFDHFWLSDVWFARQFQLSLLKDPRLEHVRPGHLVHFIISLHSFTVEGTEIY